MKKTVLFLLIFIACLSESKACSCIEVHFCDYIRDTAVHVAVRAKVLGSVVYAPDNFAVYLEVLHTYKDLDGITDTIKVYGNENDFACFVHVLNFFPVGDTVIAAFSIYQIEGAPLINPDSLTEHFYEVRPTLCNMVVLNVHDGVVTGAIHPNVESYPLSHFDEALTTCQFPVVGVSDFLNPDPHFSIYPNPAAGGKLYVRNERQQDPIEKIRVRSIDGRLIREYAGLTGNLMEINQIGNGVRVLEIHSGGQIHYRKVIVL